MLDPAFAIGLAASIVQIINFIKGVLTKSHEIYQSTDGVLVQNADLECVAVSFSKLLAELRENSRLLRPQTYVSRVLTQADAQLRTLSSGVDGILVELLNTLNSLKVDPQHTRWDSIRQSLRSTLKEAELEDLEKRLERYRQQIDTALLVSLRQSVAQIQADQESNKEELKHSLDLLGIYCQSYRDILARLENSCQFPSARANDIPIEFSSELLALVSDRDDETREGLRKQQLAESLTFEDMPIRKEAISKAYHNTFEWIFTNSAACLPRLPRGQETSQFNEFVAGYAETPRWSNFSEWLQSDHRLYWITGKPGAGKSTLMKFIYSHHLTARYVGDWAVRSNQGLITPVSMGSFFFWNSGTKMQKSLLGLVRSLLYQLLQDQAHLIPLIFPKRWKRVSIFGLDRRLFSLNELLVGLNVLLSNEDRYFFLLIDGLDEVEGRESELADFVLELSHRPNVKICTSARPWPVFEDKFEDQPRLRIEELTRPDITTYITGKFQASRRFSDLQIVEPEASSDLLRTIADRAAGVFLWVYIVVESLLEGLTDGDDVYRLQQRLFDLPSELEGLFNRIINQINPAYAREASEIFQFFRAFPEDSSLLGAYFFSFTLDRAMSAKVEPLSELALPYYLDAMRRRLYSRCKCFLELGSSDQLRTSKIQYLHRTARDYIEQPHVWKKIRGLSTTYEPTSALAISLLMLVKTMPALQKSGDAIVQLQSDTIRALLSMGASQIYSSREKIDFIDEVERSATATFSRGKSPHTNSREEKAKWLPIWSAELLLPEWTGLSWSPPPLLPGLLFSSILDISFGANFHWYVRDKLASEPGSTDTTLDQQPMLFLAAKHHMYDMQLALLETNTNVGCQVNKITSGLSAWKFFLADLEAMARNRGSWDEQASLCLQIAGKFLDHGADLKAMYNCNASGKKAESGIRGIVQIIASEKTYRQNAQILEQKLEQALQRRKSQRYSLFHRLR